MIGRAAPSAHIRPCQADKPWLWGWGSEARRTHAKGDEVLRCVGRHGLSEVDDTPTPLTASFGVATTRPGLAAPDLLVAADRALYKAKRTGPRPGCRGGSARPGGLGLKPPVSTRHADRRMAGRPTLDTDEVTRRRMSRQRSRDTDPERALRSLLHGMGLRFRVHRRPVAGVRREVDVVFGRARVAVFVDGCFWHRCPDHATFPRNNAAWWEAKLATNAARDADTDRRLAEAGWLVVRVWEHETVEDAAARVAAAVRSRLISS